MVEATIWFESGNVSTLIVEDFNRLLERLQTIGAITRLDARVVSFQETRQGRY